MYKIMFFCVLLITKISSLDVKFKLKTNKQTSKQTNNTSRNFKFSIINQKFVDN